jgi:hypothetical protein
MPWGVPGRFSGKSRYRKADFNLKVEKFLMKGRKNASKWDERPYCFLNTGALEARGNSCIFFQNIIYY